MACSGGWRLRVGLAPAIPFSFQNFIKAKQYPASTQIEVQNDGSESVVFQQLFQKWTVPNQTSGLGKTYSVGSVGEGQVKQGGLGDRSGHSTSPASSTSTLTLASATQVG